MQTIYGTYHKTKYRDEETGYTVFSLKLSKSSEKELNESYVVCIADIPSYKKGTLLKVVGETQYYNDILEVEAIEVSQGADSEDVLIDYLNKMSPEIDKRIARKIIEKFGIDIFDEIKKDNIVGEIASINNMDEHKAMLFVNRMRQTSLEYEIFNFLIPFGGNCIMAIKIAEKYGLRSIYTLRTTPFLVGLSVDVPFSICDAIHKKYNGTYYSDERLDAIIINAMMNIMNSGSTYAYFNELNEKVQHLIKHSSFTNPISPILLMLRLQKNKEIILENKSGKSKIYLKRIYNSEKYSALEIKRLNNNKSLNYNERIISEVEKDCNITYSINQRQAFNCLKNTGIKIITGGPGTGKTTTVKGIIYAYEKLNPNSKIVLCAPTGRAAQKLKESTGRNTQTIHKLLDYKPYDNDFTYKDKSDPIDADFVIVDEFSMVDIELFSIFLSAIKDNTLVIFLGDKDQLPSVGPGLVMADLLKSKIVDIYELKVNFRQKNNSNIIVNANKIRRQDLELINDKKDFVMIETDDIASKLKNLIKFHNIKNLNDVQILTTTNKNESGCNSINELMQERFNKEEKNNLVIGRRKFKVNDKIIMTKNNYEVGYYNGDIGYITRINDESIEVKINDTDFEIKRKNYEDVKLAYAITIHKSQGSEFPIIIILLPEEPISMLARNLIFTAITRAKNKVYIIYEKDALKMSILKNNTSNRRCSLIDRLKEL